MPVRGARARQADLAISLDRDGIEDLDHNPASILLLQPDLGRLGVLDEVTRVHDRRILVAQGRRLSPTSSASPARSSWGSARSPRS